MALNLNCVVKNQISKKKSNNKNDIIFLVSLFLFKLDLIYNYTITA